MRELVSCEDRLKSMIISDKQENPEKINRLIKSELLYLLKNYFDICSEDMLVNITIGDNGRFLLDIKVEARDMIIPKMFVSEFK